MKSYFGGLKKLSGQKIVAFILGVLSRVSAFFILGFWYVGYAAKKFIAHLVGVTTKKTITIAAAKITGGQKFGQEKNASHTISQKAEVDNTVTSFICERLTNKDYLKRMIQSTLSNERRKDTRSEIDRASQTDT